jgi:hypothetical protein
MYITGIKLQTIVFQQTTSIIFNMIEANQTSTTSNMPQTLLPRFKYHLPRVAAARATISTQDFAKHQINRRVNVSKSMMRVFQVNPTAMKVSNRDTCVDLTEYTRNMMIVKARLADWHVKFANQKKQYEESLEKHDLLNCLRFTRVFKEDSVLEKEVNERSSKKLLRDVSSC